MRFNQYSFNGTDASIKNATRRFHLEACGDALQSICVLQIRISDAQGTVTIRDGHKYFILAHNQRLNGSDEYLNMSHLPAI